MGKVGDMLLMVALEALEPLEQTALPLMATTSFWGLSSYPPMRPNHNAPMPRLVRSCTLSCSPPPGGEEAEL